MKKRILLTGGAGFIAHHTIRHLLQNTDWEIVSLDRLDYSGNLNRISDMLIGLYMVLIVTTQVEQIGHMFWDTDLLML